MAARPFRVLAHRKEPRVVPHAWRISANRAQAITDYIDDRLLPRLRPQALDLVAAFGLTDELVRAPIDSGAEAIRQNEARDYYAKRRESGEEPVHEKDLKQKKRR